MLALDGLTVLDLSRRYPGGYTAMFLGDFGASVIKIDPPPEKPDNERYAAYLAPDRNKKTIILNLKAESGRKVLHRLAKEADVLIEGFRPGVMKGLKADYPTLRKLNPRLIYCSLSGYGPDGPYAHLPAHDMNYSALGGALSLIGARNGPPYMASNFLADMAGAGLHGLVGILIALMAREKTGVGQLVDIAYIDGVVSLLAMDASRYFYSGKVPRRGETWTTGGGPWAQVFRCKDGEYFTIGCAEPHFQTNLCKAVGRPDLLSYCNRSSFTEEEKEWLVSELAGIFAGKTRDEWFEFFKDKDTCVGPVYYFNETFADPQVQHRKMVVEIEHPKFGKVKQIGIPIKLSETPGEIRELGKPVGTHTEEVLADVGYSADEIQQLRRDGAIG